MQLKVVTNIRPQKSQRRWNIFLDGQFAFPVAAEVALKTGLKVGQKLEPFQIEALTSLQTVQSCVEAALRYLRYRPRSEQELRRRLSQRGFDQETIAHAIKRLKEMGQINNLAFAQFWVENRQAFRPRSRLRLRQELQAKEVETETIDAVIKGLDDKANAYLIAQKKQSAWTGSDAKGWRRRMGAYLSRRGFSYGVIRDTLKRLAEDCLESAHLDRGQLSK
jgi:regulatory protein